MQDPVTCRTTTLSSIRVTGRCAQALSLWDPSGLRTKLLKWVSFCCVHLGSEIVGCCSGVGIKKSTQTSDKPSPSAEMAHMTLAVSSPQYATCYRYALARASAASA
jgi:hypothetical protein